MKFRLNKTAAIVLIVTGLIMASVASYLIEPAQATESCPGKRPPLSRNEAIEKLNQVAAEDFTEYEFCDALIIVTGKQIGRAHV